MSSGANGGGSGSGSGSSSGYGDSDYYNNGGNWIGVVLTLIISLVIAITLVLLLYISAWCLLRRSTARRRSRINQLISEATIVRSQALEPPITGLDPSVIASLPVFAYRELNHQHDKNVSKECAVCLGLFQDEEMIRLLPNCKHFFHADCINRWLISNTTCPICRCTVQSRAPPVLHEVVYEVVPLAPPVLSDSGERQR